MNIVFENNKCETKFEKLNLGKKKIINVKHLKFEDDEVDDIDTVLKRILKYAKKNMCSEIWIPSDKITGADSKLEKLGFKQGELQATLPGNSPTGWTLKLG